MSRSLGKISTGKGTKKSRSANMAGLGMAPSEIKKEILDRRAKQSIIIGKIKDDLKKIRENNISIGGLEDMTPKSVTKLQERRKKSLSHLNATVQELDILLKDITKLEVKYNNTKKE